MKKSKSLKNTLLLILVVMMVLPLFTGCSCGRSSGLVGTTWTMTEVDYGEAVISSLPSGTGMRLHFKEDGIGAFETLSGGTGVSRPFNYTVDGNFVTIKEDEYDAGMTTEIKGNQMILSQDGLSFTFIKDK